MITVNEMIEACRQERDELADKIITLRAERTRVNSDIKEAVTELAKANRLLSAVEVRKRKDGQPQ